MNEWCWDWYGEDFYAVSPKEFPTGPSKGKYRVDRGGACYNSSSFSQVAYRDHDDPYLRDEGTGFRVFRELPTSPLT